MWFFGPRVEAIKADEINNQLLKKYQLLDVRTPAEFKSGHIRGAVNHPLGQIQLFQGSKDKPILVICQSGMRSRQAAKALLKKGYQVKNVSGGMNAWHGPIKGGK